MQTLFVRNVNEAYHQGLDLLRRNGVRADSRAGPVLALPYPVMTVYERPTERVLMDKTRDANPFFHLVEALWMLAGRDDAALLNRYVKDFGARFAEPWGTLHGAYGYRWRRHFSVDQINPIIHRLTQNPDDRRLVLTMWDPDRDLVQIDPPYKDVPCNTHIYPRIVEGALDLTVLCRSNDMIWGAYGANAVHFSFLQEYLAGRIGVKVGRMYQFSNNMHAYVDVLEKLERQKVVFIPRGMAMSEAPPDQIREMPYVEPYDTFSSLPIGTDWVRWDEDLANFMAWLDEDPDSMATLSGEWRNEWFTKVAAPMVVAHKAWRGKSPLAAVAFVEGIASPDWRAAVGQWFDKRMS